MPNPIGIGVNIKNGQNPNAHLDYWYGPYNDIDEAKTATHNTIDSMSGATEVHRYIGMTVGIIDSGGGVDEYWFKDGITDNDLVPKIPNINVSTVLNGMKIAQFDRNGGQGHQNSELSDAEGWVHLPLCGFTPPSSSSFLGWGLTNAQVDFSEEEDVDPQRIPNPITKFYAIWNNIISYTVSFDDTVITCTFNGTTISSGSSVASGSTVVFTYANQAANKAFNGWTGFQSTDNVTYGQNPETATILVTRNLNIDCIEVTLYNLTIRNVLNYGSLTLDVNTTGAIPAPSSTWLASNSEVEIEYVPNTNGWSINQWNCSGVTPTYSSGTVLQFTMPNADVHVAPQEHQASSSFTITFCEDNNDTDTRIDEYTSSTPVTLQTAVAAISSSLPTDYVIIGWAAFGTSTPIADTAVLSTDTYLYALKKYMVTMSPQPAPGGTCTQTNSDGLYDYGDLAVLTATPNTGYTFTNWMHYGQSGAITTNPLTIQVTQNSTYFANFSPEYHTITLSADPANGGTVSGGGTVSYGTYVTISATAAAGYKFVKWTCNGTEVSTTAQYTVQVLGDATYVANFVPEYTITVEANPTNGGTVTGGGTYGQGESAMFTANANPGYTFVNWTSNGSIVATSTNLGFLVYEDRLFIANFSQNNYTISATVNPSGSGTVNNTGTYHYGDTATLVATASEGYTFVNWTLNGVEVSTNSQYTVTVTEDAEYVANFELQSPQPIHVTTSIMTQRSSTMWQAGSPYGGIVTGGGYYDYNETVTLTATTNPGYTFWKWEQTAPSSATISYNSTYTWQPSTAGDYHFNAYFNLIDYTISATVDPAGGGTVNNVASYTGTYHYGNTVTLAADAANGYVFSHWDNNTSDTNPTKTITVTQSESHTAHFSQIDYTISATVDPPGSGTVNNTGTYHYGDQVTLTAVAGTNYTFSHWDNDTTATNPNLSITVSGDETHEAHFITPPSQVPVVGLSGTKKYASTMQDRIDNGTITSSQYTCTLGQVNTIAIVRNDATNDTKGYSVLLPQGYKVNTNSVHFYDAQGHEYDKTQYQVTCTHGLPSSSSDSTVTQTFTYNGTTLQGYFMSLDDNTPTTVKFIIENE